MSSTCNSANLYTTTCFKGIPLVNDSRIAMHSRYMRCITLQELPKTIKWLVHEARKADKGGHPFDVIAIRGFSGAVPASIVAFMLRKPLVIVRKKPTVETSHGTSVEILTDGILPTPFRYLIIDDQSSTGKTFREIKEGLKNHTFIGSLLYSSHTAKWEP